MGYESWFFSVNGSQAYVLNDGDVTVVAVRGTEVGETLDFKHCLDTNPTPTEWGGAVHSGFMACARDLRSVVADALEPIFQTAEATGSKPSIHYTGHSLGGAVAVLLALDLMEAYPKAPVTVHTFGCPRLGDSPFKQYVSSNPGIDVYRFVNCNDIIAMLPVYAFFTHVGETYMLDSRGGLDIGIDRKAQFVGFFVGVWRGLRAGGFSLFGPHSIRSYRQRLQAI
jgi:predicted lipase